MRSYVVCAGSPVLLIRGRSAVAAISSQRCVITAFGFAADNSKAIIKNSSKWMWSDDKSILKEWTPKEAEVSIF